MKEEYQLTSAAGWDYKEHEKAEEQRRLFRPGDLGLEDKPFDLHEPKQRNFPWGVVLAIVFGIALAVAAHYATSP